MGDVLLHRTQSTVPPDQVGDHPSTVCEEQATYTGKCWYQHSYACPETVEDMPYFSTLSRLSSYSHLLITHTVTCPQMDVLLGRATHPCPLFQENSVCFAPLTEEFQSGETSLWVSPFTHGTPCLQFSQPKVLFKWLWRLFYIL